MRLKSKICAGMNWLLGDWWKPVYDGESWGICHRWRPYRREYGMTKIMNRVFTIKQSAGGNVHDYAEYAMTWQAHRTPELSDFKAHWGDLLYMPFHEDEEIVELEIVELVPKEK